MININYKQYVRDRRWFGFRYIVCEISDVREWAYSYEGIGYTTVPNASKFWVIKQLNKYA